MDTQLHILLFKVFHIHRKQMRSDMHNYGLYPGQPKVLRYINAHKDSKLSEIAKECDIECATASKILDSLTENEMVERHIDPKNKRALQVNITKKGQKALSLWEAHCKEIEAVALQGFDESEVLRFKQDMIRIYENLSNKKT